jgi:hypothetical protein
MAEGEEYIKSLGPAIAATSGGGRKKSKRKKSKRKKSKRKKSKRRHSKKNKTK